MPDSGVRQRPEFWPVALLSVALVAVLAGWAATSYLERTRSDPACDAADRRCGSRWRRASPGRRRRSAQRLAARDRCLEVVVSARESADVLREVAGSSAVEPPDAWLPESTLWLRRARDAGAFQVPAEGVSVASTPIVLALDERSADPARLAPAARWTGRVWSPPNDRRVPVVAARSRRSARSASAPLLGIRALAGDRAAGAAPPSCAGSRRGRSRWPARRRRRPTGPGADEAAVVSTEQEVLRGRYGQVAVYPPRPRARPRLPVRRAVLQPARAGRRRVPARCCSPTEGVAALTARTACAPPPARRPPARSRPGGSARPATRPRRYRRSRTTAALLNAWGGVHISARMLAVLDISGSMDARVPGTGDTRLSATVKAAQGGVGLLLGTTEIGIWTFSTDLDGDRDYREVVPVGPVGPRRAEIVQRLGQVRVKPNGATGLYDTTLAAYRDGDAQLDRRAGSTWCWSSPTARTTTPAGSAAPSCCASWRALQDRKRPLPILFIGVGPDIDPAELQPDRQGHRRAGGADPEPGRDPADLLHRAGRVQLPAAEVPPMTATTSRPAPARRAAAAPASPVAGGGSGRLPARCCSSRSRSSSGRARSPSTPSSTSPSTRSGS